MKAKREKFPISFILFDIDHFKKINDNYGHDAGDVVLSEIGKLSKGFFRETDCIIRYGGEEFLIIMPHVEHEKALKRAEAFARHVRVKINVTPKDAVHVAVSAGVTTFPGHGKSGIDLITAADKALYQAKKAGRNRVYSGRL